MLPNGSAEPGPFRSERTPYAIPILRAFARPEVKRVVSVMGSQMGKTDSVLNVVGWRLDDDPAPVMYVAPSKSFVENQAEPRLMAMLRSSASLWGKLAKGKANRKTMKLVSGAVLRLAWAGSATELSSQAAALALIDERDRMGGDVDGEGDVVELVAARGFTYADFTLGIFSTPTRGNVTEERDDVTGLTRWAAADPADVESPTWKLWQEGTRQEWAWPCPDCGDYFIPRFNLLRWPEGASPARAAREARLCCPHCGSMIPDSAKPGMNALGVYVAPGQAVSAEGIVTGPEPESDTASFWVSGLCSPWVSWGQRAKSFIEANRSGDLGRVQTVLNTGFGELFKVGGATKPWEAIAGAREPYRLGELPAGVAVVTCGVDVQKNRLVWAVRGWGYRMESWLLGQGELWGETEQEEVWADLAGLLDTIYGDRRIALMLIDSGFRPGDRFRTPDHRVYEFARQHRTRARATKGHDRQDKPVYASKIDINLRGRPLPSGLQLWHLDSDHFKSWVLERLDWPADAPGAWHISQDATNDYCQQLTAEARLVKPSGQATWIRVRRDNHFLDCEALNVAAAYMLGLNSNRPVPAPTPEPVPEQDRPMEQLMPPRPRVVRSNYIQRVNANRTPRW